MIKTSTRDELIRYIYGESTKNETDDIINLVLCDNKANQDFDEIANLKMQLNQVQEEPSNSCVDRILKYSRQFEMPQFTD